MNQRSTVKSKLRNAVTNTTHEMRSAVSGITGLAAVIAMGDGGIERQEAAGQAELCMSDVLPTQGIEKVRKMIESNGGSIGDHVPKDPMFRNVKLPPGWKKQASDHSMWSSLIDDKGRKRAAIFYKAAFYDRSAHIDPVRRFGIESYSHDPKTDGFYRVKLTDVNNQVEFEVSAKDDPEKRSWEIRDVLQKQVSEYLNVNYPGWEDVNSYWD